MPGDNTVEVGLGFKATDKTGLDLIKQTADSLDRARESIAAAQKQGGLSKIVASGEVEGLTSLTNQAAKTAQELLDLTTSMEGLAATDAGFDEKSKEVARLTEQLQALNNEAAKTAIKTEGLVTPGGDSKKGISGKEGASQALSGIGGLASSVSPEAGQAAQLLQQLLQVGDGFKKLSGILIDAPGIIGSVATSAATLAAPLGATAAGLAAVAAVLLPVVLAVAGLAVVITRLNTVAKQGEIDAQAYADALDSQVKVDREIANLLKSGDVEAAKKRYKELQDAQTDANAQLTYLYQKKADIDKQYTDAQRNVNVEQLAYLGSEGGKIADQIKDVYEKQFTPAKQAVDEFGKSLDQITKAAADKESLNASIKAITDRATIEQQLSGIIRQGNDGAIKDRKQAIQDELDQIQTELPQLKALGDTNEDVAAAVKTAEDRSRDLKNELNLYSPAAEAAAKAQKDLNQASADQLAAMTQQVDLQQQIADLTKSASTTQLDDRVDSLNTERDAILSQLDGIKRLGSTSTEAAAKALEYENRLKAIGVEMDALGNARPGVRQAEITKGQDEMIAAEAEADNKIADIRQSGLDKIAAIEAQAGANLAAAKQKETDSDAKTNADEKKQIGQVDSDYMKGEIEAWAKFRDDTAKEESKNKKARLRSIDDTNAALLEAEKGNDVIAFIAAANKGKAQLKQIDEDAKDAADERTAQFLQEREQAKTQHDDRIKDIQAQAQAQRDAAAVQYEIDKKAAEKQRDEALKAQNDQQEQLIAAEEAGLLQRVSAIQDTYHLEDSLIQDIFDKRKARYTDDDKIVNDRLDLELQRHADDLKRKADAEIAENTRSTTTKNNTERNAGQQTAAVIGQSFGGAVTVIQSGLTNFINYIKAQLQAAASSNISGYGSSGSGGTGSSSYGSGGTATPTAFANEGVVKEKTFAMLGENLTPGQLEAVIKFKPSEGLPKSMGGGGTTINLSFGNIDLGGISRTEFMDGMHELAGEVLDGLGTARRPTE